MTLIESLRKRRMLLRKKFGVTGQVLAWERELDEAADELERKEARIEKLEKWVKRIAKQPTLDELPEDAEGGDPESAYDIIVYEAREVIEALTEDK